MPLSVLRRFENKTDESVAIKYTSVYGQIIPVERNYILLEGAYSNAANEKVLMPPILFIFKAGSWVEGPAQQHQ